MIKRVNIGVSTHLVYEKNAVQFLEGVSFFSYIACVVRFELVYKNLISTKIAIRRFFPFLNYKSSISCKLLNKGFLKKKGLVHPYIGLLKNFVQVQHNVPFVYNFFLRTFYTQSNGTRGTFLTMQHNFLFKHSLTRLFVFDFFRIILLAKLYKLNQFVSVNILKCALGSVVFRFKFHEVLLRSFFIMSTLDETVDQQTLSFKFFQFLNDFGIVNEPAVFELYFQKIFVNFNVFENVQFLALFLSFFGFSFSNQFSNRFSHKFFIKLI